MTSPADTPKSPVRAGWVLACIAATQFLVALDLSLLNVALPDIQDQLGLTGANLSWVITAYTLLYGGVLMLGGRLGDLFGQRPVLLIGLTIFGVASLAGGFATDGGVLITARAVQGLGAALVAPAGLALVAVHFPDEGAARARALGLWSATTLIGGIVGVLLSGVLTGAWGWRAVMFVNVLAVIICIVTVLPLPRRRTGGTVRVDWAGAVLVTAGMLLLTLGASMAEHRGFGSAWTLVPLLVGLAALVVFVLVERRVAEPIIRITLFRHRAVVAASLFGLMVTAGQLAAQVFISLHMQNVLGFTPVETGLAFLPFSLGAAVSMWIGSKLLPRTGPRALLVAAGLVGATGIAWFGFGSPDGTFISDVLWPSLLASLGLGASFVAMGGAATAGVPPEDAGMVSGLLNTSRLLGGSLGLAILAIVAAAVTSGAGGSENIAALSDGYNAGLLGAAGLIAIGAVYCLTIPKPTPDAEPPAAPPTGTDHPPDPAR